MPRTICSIEPGRQPARGHWNRGQDLPRERRSRARDAARPCGGPSGDGAPPRAVGPHRRRDQQSRKAVCAGRGRGARGAPTSRTSAMPARGELGRDSLARGGPGGPGADLRRAAATPRLRTRRGARGRRPTAMPMANRSAARTRATCSGGPSSRRMPALRRRSLTSVTAAYLPRNLRPDVVSITVHPPGTVFQRPFSTGEMEIAGFEDNTSDGRQPAQSQSSAHDGSSGSASRPRSAAVSIRRVCRRSSGRRRTETTIGCSTTSCIGAKGKRPGRRSNAGCGIRSTSGTRRRFPTVPTSSRSPRRMHRRIRPGRRSSARWRA